MLLPLMHHIVAAVFLFLFTAHVVNSSWDEWWTYEGISGVDFWGVLNPDWKLCKEGKRQSPISINPESLIFDPNLPPILIDSSRVRGVLENNGHSIVFQLKERLDDPPESPSPSSPSQSSISSHSQHHAPHDAHFVNISGGPLSYSYSFESIHLHFGRSDGIGSEHTISGLSFAGELQINGFNSDLYRNSSEASRKPNGLVSIALLIQLGDSTSEELRILCSVTHRIRFKGQTVPIPALSIRRLIGEAASFITYEGSMSVPGCYETVTWVIINKPLIISRQDMHTLRKIMQGDSDLPKAPLGNNFRPVQTLNQRFLRTNIDFRRHPGNACSSSNSFARRNYEINSRHLSPGPFTP